MVVAPGGAFVEAGPRGGRWERATAEDLAVVGVDRDASSISGLPQVLDSFVARSDIGFGEISGDLDVREGLRGVGIRHLLVQDKELAEPIGGSPYARARLSKEGDLVSVAIDGTSVNRPVRIRVPTASGAAR